MILTGENRSTRKIIYPNGASSTTYPIYTGLVFNTSHRGVRPLTNSQSHSKEKLIQYIKPYLPGSTSRRTESSSITKCEAFTTAQRIRTACENLKLLVNSVRKIQSSLMLQQVVSINTTRLYNVNCLNVLKLTRRCLCRTLYSEMLRRVA